MWTNQIFSLCRKPNESDLYVIENIIVADNYAIAGNIAKVEYGDSAIAVETTSYPVIIGDQYDYSNDVFYRDGVIIERNATEAEELEKVKNENKDLHEKLLNTQMALTELYEMLS